MSTFDIIVQLIGFLGLGGFCLSYQLKSNKGLFAAQIAGNGMFLLQFFLLDALSGSYNLIPGIIRNIMLLYVDRKPWIRWKGWVVVFLIVYFTIMCFTWSGWVSVLPFIAMSSCTIAYWSNNARNIRIANLFFACPAWILYDIYYGSIAGILNESITILSILISIYRFGWKALGENNPGQKKKG